jgi:hypothetical protein
MIFMERPTKRRMTPVSSRKQREGRLLSLSIGYLVFSFSIFALHASPIEAPIFDSFELAEAIVVKSKPKLKPAAMERGIKAYLSEHLQDITPAKADRMVKLIVRLCRKHRFDPGLILSVMHVESGFRPWAVSAKGALGLMQIMPETGEWLSRRYQMKWEGPVTLMDEEANIAIGIRYLAYLRDKYDGDLKKMLSAYNRGPAKVDEETASGRKGTLEYYRKVKSLLPKLAFEPSIKKLANVN